MEVQHYFDAIDFLPFKNSRQFNWKYSMGETIEKNTLALKEKNIQKIDIAIIGVPFDSRQENTYCPASPNKIRAQLYELSKLNTKANIFDFGNLKPASSTKGNYQALRDIIDYFKELEIVSIVIGGSQDLSVGICEAFQNDSLFSFSTIDAFLDIKRGKETFNSSNYLSRIFKNQPDIFQFNLIGFQSHYLPLEFLSKTKGFNNHVRLGKLRDEFETVEPIFRNTDFLSFDIGAIKHSEAPGNFSNIPNGLRSEEACQLAKYAGTSSRLKVFGLFEIDLKSDRDELTAKLSAQIVWYFLDGYVNRNNESPDVDKNNTMYQVEVKGVDKPLVFFRNNTSNNWWMQIQTFNKKMLYFACSEKDYQQASKNEIPELWINYIQKLDEKLK